MTTRKPAVAGYFYPGEEDQLRRELDRCLVHKTSAKKKAIGVVSPHAGYKYSGAVAGEVFGQIQIPARVIVLSPNHTGEGAACSLWSKGEWQTPLGAAKVDEELAARFLSNCPLLKEDTAAHRAEHSLEVQIPFLQFLKKDFQFVPLTLSYIPLEQCRAVGQALAKTIRESKTPVLMVASSDMNHFENQEITGKKDFLAIEQIQKLDAEGLYRTVRQNRISMCGIIPTTVMLFAAKELGATKGELIRHATSGDVTGDYGSVVGYAGLVIA